MARRKTYETHFLLGAKVQSSVGKSFSKVQKNMKGIRKSASYTESSYKKLGSTMKRALGAAGIYFSARTIVTQLNASTKAAMNFEDQMADVATLLDGDVSAKITKASKQTKKLAIDTGITTDQLTKGYYETVSAIGGTADTYAIFEKASKNARAGNVAVNESVKFLSVNMKGYNSVSQETAQKVSDLGFMTVKLGQTTFPELAGSMGKVIPLAGAMGANMESVYGAMATLTGVTGDTAEVSTQLRGVFAALTKPTAAMQSTIQGLGFSSGKAMIEAKGLQGTLNLLKKASGGSEQKMAEMFGRVEALNAVLALTGPQAENFTNKTEAMYNAVGMSNKAFEEKIKTSKALRERFGQLLNVLQITAGNKVLPYINQGLEYMLENYDEIAASAKKAMQPIVGTYQFISNNWSKIEPIVVGITSALIAYKTAQLAVAAAQKTGMIIETLSSAYSTAQGIMNAYRASTLVASKAQVLLNLAMSANPVGILVVAIGALITAGYYLYKNWGKISKWWTNMWSSMSETVGNIVLNVKAHIAKMMRFIPEFLLPDSAKKWRKEVMLEYNEKNAPKVAGQRYQAYAEQYMAKNNKEGNSKAVNKAKNIMPKLAKGTNNFDGGLAIVGEKGPELVNMPRGTHVTPTTKTERILHLIKNTPSKAETLLNKITNNTTNNNSTSISVKIEQIIKGNPDKKTLKESNNDLEDKIERIIKKYVGDPRTSFA